MTAVTEATTATSHDAKWMAQLVSYKAFLSEHGRRPNPRCADRAERQTALWLRYQTERNLGGILRQDRRAVLDEHLPGWDVHPWEVQWLARLDHYQAFEIEHGRRPGYTAGDDYERSLGLWFRDQLRDAREGRVSDARCLVLDERIPGWLIPRGAHGRKAAARVQELKTYRDAYGKWPSKRSRDPVVSSLAGWYYTQREGAGTAQTRALLDAQVPGWNETVQETWERTAQEIATFRARHGELPSASSKVPHVKAWGRWIGDMRRGRGMTPARTAHLNAVLPGWRIGGLPGTRPAQLETTQAAAVRWSAHLGRYVAFVDEHHRWPRVRASGKAERFLGVWLQAQRNHAGNGTLPEERRRILNETLPGWNTSAPAPGPQP